MYTSPKEYRGNKNPKQVTLKQQVDNDSGRLGGHGTVAITLPDKLSVYEFGCLRVFGNETSLPSLVSLQTSTEQRGVSHSHSQRSAFREVQGLTNSELWSVEYCLRASFVG